MREQGCISSRVHPLKTLAAGVNLVDWTAVMHNNAPRAGQKDIALCPLCKLMRQLCRLLFADPASWYSMLMYLLLTAISTWMLWASGHLIFTFNLSNPSPTYLNVNYPPSPGARFVLLQRWACWCVCRVVWSKPLRSIQKIPFPIVRSAQSGCEKIAWWRCWVSFFLEKKKGGSEEWRMEVWQWDPRKILRMEVWWLKSLIENFWWTYFWNPSYNPLTGEWGQIFKSLSQVIDAAAKTVGHVAAQWWSRCSACWDWNKMKEATNEISKSLFPQEPHFSDSCWVELCFLIFERNIHGIFIRKSASLWQTLVSSYDNGSAVPSGSETLCRRAGVDSRSFQGLELLAEDDGPLTC